MEPVLGVDGMMEVLRRFTSALEEHRDELDSLNVFPVPDGDTGTNLLLTMRGVMAELDRGGSDGFAALVADSALMSARGNSGVILAQTLRALVAGIDGGLAEVLGAAAHEARRAVARPLDGTVLSVLADAAAAARRVRGGDAEAAVAARDAAAESLDRTTAALPELADAGVVDAGGLGVLLLLDALASVATGTPMQVRSGRAGPVGRTGSEVAEQDVGFRFEVMFLLRTDDGHVPALREQLDDLGGSLVVVGGDGRYRVHLHTDDPDRAVAVADVVGATDDVRVVNLEEEVAERCVAGQARAARVGESRATALVAIVEGEGLVRLFRSLGAVAVPGGPGDPPAVDELIAGIESTDAPSVVVLPNHPAMFHLAEEAAGATPLDVWVAGARTIPEGLSAAAAFNPTAPADALVEHMTAAAGMVATAAMSRAGDGSGGWVGLVGGVVSADGIDPIEVARRLLAWLRNDDQEVITIFVGAKVGLHEFEVLAAALREEFSDLRVEVHDGGQQSPDYLFGLE